MILPQTHTIACLSAQGRLLAFALDEIRTLANGGRGVILMGLEDKETLLAVQPAGEKGVLVSGTGRGGKTQELRLTGANFTAMAGKRARKGKKLGVKYQVTALSALE